MNTAAPAARDTSPDAPVSAVALTAGAPAAAAAPATVGCAACAAGVGSIEGAGDCVGHADGIASESEEDAG